jgi:AAA15 family ATPase/GTPase
MPVSVLGDGARRYLEFAAAASKVELYIDEIENGFHWSVLGSVWALLRRSACEQIFATTHREEAIRLACEEFVEAGDDTLRVLRIDRDGDGHRVVSYTAAEGLAALDAGLELRG